MAVPQSFRIPLHTLCQVPENPAGRMRDDYCTDGSWVLRRMPCRSYFPAQADGHATTNTIAHGRLRVPCEIKLDAHRAAYLLDMN